MSRARLQPPSLQLRLAFCSVAAVLTSCGSGGGALDDDGGTPGDAGGLLLGADCPDECIPRCHFQALSAFGECFPHGQAVCDWIDDVSTHHCYDNGVKWGYSHTSNYSISTYYKDGAVCFAYDADHGGVGTELVRIALRGKDDRLLEVVDFADPTSTEVFSVTCDGEVRQVDLTVNATSPACAQCPEDPFLLPPNPDPPVNEWQNCDLGVCEIP